MTLSEQQKYLDDVWGSQQRAKAQYGDEGISYLKHLSSGGVAALLAFIGATEWAPKNLYILYALGLFALAVICTGALIWYMYLRSVAHFGKFDRGRLDFMSGNLDFSGLNNGHKQRTNESITGAKRLAIFISILLLSGVGFACWGFWCQHKSLTNRTTETKELSSTRSAPPIGTFNKFSWWEPRTA